MTASLALNEPWVKCLDYQIQILPWLNTCRVELDRDPTSNIGTLHEKVSQVRSLSNQVRGSLLAAMSATTMLKREAATTRDEYERQLSKQGLAHAKDEVYSKLKSKEERELYIREEIRPTYELMREAEQRVEDWDAFIAQIKTVYFSLTDTRKDIDAQIAVIKQQMFKGEIKPNEQLGKLNSLADLIGSDSKEFLGDLAGTALGGSSPEPDPTVGNGEVSWG